jgi:hypothetical protein
MIADEKFHHSVYVILLDPVTLGLPSIVRLNPNRDSAKPCVYVGMTGLPVEQRFENHKRPAGHSLGAARIPPLPNE